MEGKTISCILNDDKCESIQEENPEEDAEKTIQDIVYELTATGKVMMQLDGSRNVCQTFDFIFEQESDFLQHVSGVAFELEGFTQVVGYVDLFEKLKNKVLLGKTYKTRTYPYQIHDGLEMNLIEGFDDLDRRLKKLKVWGCSFVILQIDHGNLGSEGKSIPLDNSYYFGIFSASVQALGMVPIIQFKYDWSLLSEEECQYIFLQTMSWINGSCYDFDVQIDGLMISQLIKYPPKRDPHQKYIENTKAIVTNLQRALPPAIGGVVFFAEGNPKVLAWHIDRIVKMVDRIPWPIVCGYNGNVPVITGTDKDILMGKWFDRQLSRLELLSYCNRGVLYSVEPEPTVLTDDFIKSHDYHERFYSKK